MARGPLGVEIGVSGAAQTHSGQPGSQVSCSFGSMHSGGPTGPAGTTQQSIPAIQQLLPQQNVVASHEVPASHGGAAQVPLAQNGFGPSHTVPQLPQFWMSLPLFTHT